MNWTAIRKGVALYRAIRLINRSLEYLDRAEDAASFASDYKIGDFEVAWSVLQSNRGALVDRMDVLFDLDPQKYADIEDAAIGEAG